MTNQKINLHYIEEGNEGYIGPYLLKIVKVKLGMLKAVQLKKKKGKK